MPSTEYSDTIDWEDYWTAADEQRRDDTSPSADLVVEPLLAFFETVTAPDSYADVGCGPGDAVVAVANHYPTATVVGYDAAESVLTDNRRRYSDRDNLTFERAVLPHFDPDRQFDVVSCLFTLCYVADADTAVQHLYDAVAPGGHLILQYHNRLAHAHYNRIAEDPHAFLDDDTAWNPETFADRFALTIAGENLLSYDRIHDILGTWPQSLFARVDGAEQYGAHRYEPLVYVPKPA